MVLHEWENVVDSIKDKTLFSLDLSIIMEKNILFSALLNTGFQNINSFRFAIFCKLLVL